MIVNIQISDSAYAQLLNGTKRLQGTLALVNPTEGNFHEHNKTWRPKPGTKYMKLPHGRITVNDENVRMNLHIKRDESIVPARASSPRATWQVVSLILWRNLYEFRNSKQCKK